MKLGTYKPHHLMMREASRYRMDAAKLEIEDGRGSLIVTNGRALAVLPVELHPDDKPGLIPGEALGCEKLGHDTDGCEVIEYVVPPKQPELIVSPDGCKAVVDHEAPKGEFPQWRNVMPPDDAAYACEFAISPKLLHELACALGSETAVRLRVQKNLSHPVRVEAFHGKAVGAIMLVVDDDRAEG